MRRLASLQQHLKCRDLRILRVSSLTCTFIPCPPWRFLDGMFHPGANLRTFQLTPARANDRFSVFSIGLSTCRQPCGELPDYTVWPKQAPGAKKGETDDEGRTLYGTPGQSEPGGSYRESKTARH